MGSTNECPFQRVAQPRRQILAGGLAVLTLFSTRRVFAAISPLAPRTLTFQNLHTGESVNTTYWADGTYLPEGLSTVAKVLRDHRNDHTHPIEPALLDLLHRLQGTLGTKAGFQVISGYRSPESNAKLHAASNGVATHSLHMEGKAIDIRIASVDLKHLQNAARALTAGGVGYYPASDFVHVDVGRVRYW